MGTRHEFFPEVVFFRDDFRVFSGRTPMQSRFESEMVVKNILGIRQHPIVKEFVLF